jgi:hypothetical protein
VIGALNPQGVEQELVAAKGGRAESVEACEAMQR